LTLHLQFGTLARPRVRPHLYLNHLPVLVVSAGGTARRGSQRTRDWRYCPGRHHRRRWLAR